MVIVVLLLVVITVLLFTWISLAGQSISLIMRNEAFTGISSEIVTELICEPGCGGNWLNGRLTGEGINSEMNFSVVSITR